LQRVPRGHLTKKLIERFDLDEGKNPQIYSLGLKELWRVPKGNIEEGRVYHTIGYPLEDRDEFVVVSYMDLVIIE